MAEESEIIGTKTKIISNKKRKLEILITYQYHFQLPAFYSPFLPSIQ